MTLNLTRTLYLVRNSFLILLTLLMVSACNQETAEEKAMRMAPTLTDNNVRKFVSIAGKDYDQILDRLEVAYDKYKAEEDSLGFIGYRNTKWTWEYIELKNHYAAVLKKNRKFVASHSLQPIFDQYEGILLIGLDLKHALTENNRRRERRAFESIKRGRIVMAKALLKVSQASAS
ncbi:hypothetical protein [Aliamphritea ceti]|uniref:hypothetical protein n=1 Tax=Aliamphritea ceti TaxID=1524258 RepID=UPI0021C493FA|nr:hypothetical protein [Aliamphritea ceti]